MKLSIIYLALCCSSLVRTSATAAQVLPTSPDVQQTAARAVDDELDARLRELDKKTQAIHDLVADFQQQKYTALLKKPLTSEGTLRIKGPAMRWDTKPPQQSVIAVDESSVKMYYPAQRLVEIYPIEKKMSQLTASPLVRIEQLQEQFTIERSDWTQAGVALPSAQLTITLIPKETELQQHLESVRILFDMESGFVIAAEVIYPDSDRLVIMFTNIRANIGLKDEDVHLVVPEGTTEAHPLDLNREPAVPARPTQQLIQGGDR